MNKIEDLINTIISQNLGPIPWCLLLSRDEYFQFKCLYSKIQPFEKNHHYDIYEIPALERFLAKKNQLIEADTLDSIYKNDHTRTISYIINWDKCFKTILLVQVNNQHIQNEEITRMIKEINSNKEHIIDDISSYQSGDIKHG